MLDALTHIRIAMGIIMCFFRIRLVSKYMLENICAKRPQQFFFRFKMRIKGTAPDIRLINNILNSNPVEVFMLQ